MSTIGYINVSLETFGGILSLIFIISLYIVRPKREFQERLYIRLLVCNTVLLFCDASAWLFKGRPDIISAFAVRFSNFFVYTFGYVMLVLFSHYLINFLQEKQAPVTKMILYLMRTVMAVAVALTVISQFNGMYYFIDEGNYYQRAPLFWLSQSLGLLGLVINGSLLIRYHSYLKKRELIAFGVYITLPVTALIFQTLVYSVATLYLSTTICLLCIYLSIQFEISRETSQRELELEKNRNALMLSQIQPHFLFNSLATIKGLCQLDPSRAELAIDHFSAFLRGNINALNSSELLPFTRELYHTEQYLDLEQMRFGKRLQVVYDTPVTLFHLPSLTLQPIVENAVRHGLMKQRSGGTVTIRTSESETHFIVSVIDDGVGFFPGKPMETDRAHIGIANVRARLQGQCNGLLDIQSTPGTGTTVCVLIPKEVRST